MKEGDGSAIKLHNREDGIAVSTSHAGTTAVDVNDVEGAVQPDTHTPGNAGDQLGNGSVHEGTESQTNGNSTRLGGPRFRVLDALSATGLRALRYAKELPFVTKVVANDMNPNATKSMALNVQHNDLSAYITPNTGDAIGHMYSVAFPPTGSHGPQHVSGKYDVVDLDPYGTAAPFIDAALHSLNDGGLLCVTCTDSGVFASTGYCEKTFSLYGGMPVKGSHMHEGGLRLIINLITSTAAKYGMSVEPLLSLSIDFYIRVFVRVRRSPADVKFLAGKTMLVYSCDHGCGAWTTNIIGRNTKQEGKAGNIWYKHSIGQAPTADRVCGHCGSKTHIAGPMWAGPLHNAAFIGKMLDDLKSADPEVYETIPRIEGMLQTALDELSVNPEVTSYVPVADRKKEEITDMVPIVPPEVIDQHPFFINPSALSKVIHCVAPSTAAMNGALRHAGYRATRSHCQPGCIKTDAPWSFIWEIMREWVRQKQPIKEGALKEGSPGWRIMQAARQEEEPASPANESTPEIITDAAQPDSKDDKSNRIKVVFDEVLGKDLSSKRLLRYQVNPRENWGPMTKAKGSSGAKAD